MFYLIQITLSHTIVLSCTLYPYVCNFLDLCTQHFVFHIFAHIMEYITRILSSTINHDTCGSTVSNQSPISFTVQYLSHVCNIRVRLQHWQGPRHVKHNIFSHCISNFTVYLWRLGYKERYTPSTMGRELPRDSKLLFLWFFCDLPENTNHTLHNMGLQIEQCKIKYSYSQ